MYYTLRSKHCNKSTHEKKKKEEKEKKINVFTFFINK